MKLVLVVYEAGVDDSVTELLKQLALPGWTKLEGAVGFGRKGLRLGTPIWPGTNHVLFAALEEEAVAGFLQALDRLKQGYRKPPAIHTFVLPLEG
ncbi:MAG: hypothetical protein C4304_00135 [candidate division GAL15 bacterium]